ncbi:hypothetical protein NE865_12877 [Phthorimaea operculella]|nr:hypothetical protein NE865_12877 [Phthorimaea operculella]
MVALRLRRVTGLEGRTNDVVLAPPAVRPDPTRGAPVQTLVFFGGDVQDYSEVMAAHRDNRNYQRWNLESTARNLSNNFPSKYIVVIRPSRIEYKSFSCYDNFVPSNNAGVPDHTPMHGALLHLEKLLQGVSNRLKTMPTSELLEAVNAVSLPEEIDIEELQKENKQNSIQPPNSRRTSKEKEKPTTVKGAPKTEPSRSNGASRLQSPVRDALRLEPEADPLWWRNNQLDQSRLTLVGFSKGCVALNQFIYEFHYTKTLTPGDQAMMRFMESIEAMYWLDGGHAGGKNTWITARSLLETLTRLDISVYVHVSPYQVKDEGRPWIGREEKQFTGLLNKLGARVQRYLHEGPGGPQNLLMHFEVLDKFKRVQDSTPPPPLSDSSDEDT